MGAFALALLLLEARDSGAVAGEEADPESLAYLTDRLPFNEGKPQRYGTQGNGAAGDVSRLNANRKALGLEPLSAR